MKRCAAATLGLYLLALATFTIPVLWAGTGDYPGFDIFTWWPYWAFCGLLLVLQAALLFVPVRAESGRPVGRRSIVFLILVTAALLATLCWLAVFALDEAILRNDVERPQYLWVKLGIAGAAWLGWGWIFYRYSAAADPRRLVRRLMSRLLIGSILELVVAVPAHIIVRRRDECCAGIYTFTSIACGAAITLLAFGPGVFFLLADRVKRRKR